MPIESLLLTNKHWSYDTSDSNLYKQQLIAAFRDAWKLTSLSLQRKAEEIKEVL